MTPRLLVLLFWLALTHISFAQNHKLPADNPWSFQDEAAIVAKHANRRIIPEKYRTAHLDVSELKLLLTHAPLWQTDDAAKHFTKMTLPMPDGSFQSFRILEAPVMHPALAKKYPEIKSYAGAGLDDPTAYLRFDLTPKGFHGMILSGNGSDVFIDPYADSDTEHYVVYFKKDFQKNAGWACLAHEVNPDTDKKPLPPIAKAGDCKLRTYKLALACTGEYAQFHGGTVASALAAMNTTMTRVNGVYERELSVTLQMVANNDLLIYTNPNSDPYTNNSGSTMLSQNQTNCDAKIGSANYDIGHVFSTGGGGIAYIKAVCNNSVKAGGVTGLSAPVGDPFDVDYVCHEMGHQFGANHTQNNDCNRNAATAMEPGSGSTIMSYAGVCAPNIQSHSDAYFHAATLQQIAAHITGNGNSCATTSSINDAPVVETVANFTIPKSTYFVLTGNATDANPNDPLTYCWEQMDNEVASMPPQSMNAAGPLFRSYPPTSSPERYFPNLDAIVNNQSPTWEKMPGVGRTMKFRLTVRDNHPGGGCTDETDVTLTVAGNAGPFVVTGPNTAVTWHGGSSQTVTWDVAGTTAAPVSCANVDILLSLDGGYTWPITLVSATPNDGYQAVTIPNEATSQARIMVRGSGNIFFDISNQNFTISQAPQFLVTASGTNVKCAGGNDGTATANATGGNGNFTYAWSNGATTQSVQNLAKGTYTVTVTSGGQTASVSVTIAEPEILVVNVGGTNATGGNNGTATAFATGGTGSFTYNWSNGGNTKTIENLSPDTYTVTVTDANGCTATGSISLTGPPDLKFEYGTVNGVTNEWQAVTLQNDYAKMVVVASIVIESSTGPSFVTRIRMAEGSSFEIKIQEAGKENAPAGPVKVFYIAAEEGVYTPAQNNVKFEARKITSVQTSRSTSWKYEKQVYGQSYANPVVLGQVMTFNDPHWSVCWSSKHGSRNKPPTPTSLSVSKHIAEDNVTTNRANETIGYFVFEAGEGFINGHKFVTAVGSDKVKGLNNSSYGYDYVLTGLDEVEALVVTAAGIDGSEGAWPVMMGVPSATNVWLFAAEDQIKDFERSHTSEQVAYFAIGQGSQRPEAVVPEVETTSGKPDPSDYFKVYPNPAWEEIFLEFHQTEPGEPHLAVLDAQGRLMFEQKLTAANAGFRKEAIDLDRLPPGCYFIRLKYGSQLKTVKVVKVNNGW